MNDHPLILLVEDTPDHAEIVIKILTHLGYSVHWENSGRKALEYCKHHHPRLFLIDIALGDLSGEEVMQLLRENHAEHLTIIAITAHSMNGSKQELLKLGFDNYLSKPFTAQELQHKIQTYLPKI